ncbi:hypothetical protein EH223_03480 [candidate division KSB1 bacterium]|nr:hypothetical protein [candidate division KSB1 bacterium]RQW05884.1 MAG: hypothetical protein EH223_03480 [candidate division KSB1 bacterium]
MEKSKLVKIFILIIAQAFPAFVRSQAIPKDEYLDYMNLEYPRLTPQSKASARLFLFGDENDPSYTDTNPMDGIDDQRHQVLQQMAVRFAPYLVQNSTVIPMNFKKFMDDLAAFHLHVDSWDIFGETAKIIDSQTINLVDLGSKACDSSVVLKTLQADSAQPVDRGANFEMFNSQVTEDCKMLSLLQEFHPENPKNKRVVEKFKRDIPDVLKVLYFDFPGEGPETWKQEYINDQTNALPSTYHDFLYSYVHPFIHEVRSNETNTTLGYELILQYWFFYPFNDGGNNHEGDWEHINVVISPLNRVEHLLSEQEIQTVLNGAGLSEKNSDDQLVIKRIEYYFHYDVMYVDFSSPNVYAPREEWEQEVKRRFRHEEHLNERDIWRLIRKRAYRDKAETQINTHPIGYIGADNKGMDQILQPPGGNNRDSHGTYPFAGIFKNIGPAGATEKIATYVDSYKLFKELDANNGKTSNVFKRGNVISLAHPDRVEIVPDWERVLELAHEHPQVRRDWSWLLLPIHWGYPATESPFAGILKHTDTGNRPPVTPSFGYGWNVSGPSFGYGRWQPHKMASVFPTGFQDSFQNNLGFLNLSYPVLLNLPPLDFAWRIAAYPIRLAVDRPDPLYYPKQEIPYRFVGLAAGAAVQNLHDDFKALVFNEQQLDEFALRFILHLALGGVDSNTVTTNLSDYLDRQVSPYYQVVFYIGDRLVSENTLRNARSMLGFNVNFNNVPSYNYSAEINMWEYAGSFRYNLTTSNFQPFIKGGYGLSWYRLENAQANGEVFMTKDSEWIRQPSISPLKNILPNTWHVGGGIEFLILKKRGRVPQGLDLSVRADYTLFVHRLGLDLSNVRLDKLKLFFPTAGSIPGGETVTRDGFNLAITLGF